MTDALRILIVCETWLGSDSYALARAFRRQGHSTTIVSEEIFYSVGWRSKPLRALRRLLAPMMVAEFNRELIRQSENLRPHLLVICKGSLVRAETVRSIRAGGARAVLWWPDVSFFVHGPEIPRAVPEYDWIFTTKTFGLADLRDRFGVTSASFLPHAYDPETHRPWPSDESDRARLACDVSFIGTWSPKKEALLTRLIESAPGVDLKIWGAQWEKANPRLRPYLQFIEVFGAEYAKAIRLSRINLGILSEVRRGAADGDRITARTFQIPASGGFMLHERSSEIGEYFVEDKECALFGDADELVAKVGYFLTHPQEREIIAAAGAARCAASAYSVDDRVATMIAKSRELPARA